MKIIKQNQRKLKRKLISIFIVLLDVGGRENLNKQKNKNIANKHFLAYFKYNVRSQFYEQYFDVICLATIISTHINQHKKCYNYVENAIKC